MFLSGQTAVGECLCSAIFCRRPWLRTVLGPRIHSRPHSTVLPIILLLTTQRPFHLTRRRGNACRKNTRATPDGITYLARSANRPLLPCIAFCVRHSTIDHGNVYICARPGRETTEPPMPVIVYSCIRDPLSGNSGSLASYTILSCAVVSVELYSRVTADHMSRTPI